MERHPISSGKYSRASRDLHLQGRGTYITAKAERKVASLRNGKHRTDPPTHTHTNTHHPTLKVLDNISELQTVLTQDHECAGGLCRSISCSLLLVLLVLCEASTLIWMPSTLDQRGGRSDIGWMISSIVGRRTCRDHFFAFFRDVSEDVCLHERVLSSNGLLARESAGRCSRFVKANRPLRHANIRLLAASRSSRL